MAGNDAYTRRMILRGIVLGIFLSVAAVMSKK